MAMQHFPRADLASEVAAAIQGHTLLGDGPNGVFLAAPRRTGKSTFLQLDLQPELARQGVLVVYVDLWADQRRDPGDLIAEAIGRSIERELGVVEKAAKRSGLESVTVGGLKINTARIGKPDGQTLTDALAFLAEKSGRPVALLIDEAQHALTSEAGENAMAALKAARDTLNRPGVVKLMLVMSGSDRDKLLRLVNTTGAPFYGSQVSRMPPLGRGLRRLRGRPDRASTTNAGHDQYSGAHRSVQAVRVATAVLRRSPCRGVEPSLRGIRVFRGSLARGRSTSTD